MKRGSGSNRQIADNEGLKCRLSWPSSSYLDVLFGILQVLKESIFSPDNATLLVGCRIRVAISLAGLATEKAVQIRSLLVRSAFLHRVALRALGLENLGSLLFTHFAAICISKASRVCARVYPAAMEGILDERQCVDRTIGTSDDDEGLPMPVTSCM